MFKRFGLSLLMATAMVSGAAIKHNAKAATAAAVEGTTAGTAAAGTAAATGATGATTAAAPVSSAPKFTDAELAAAPRAQIFTQCINPGQVVLTFDDGPSPVNTPVVLDYLAKNNLHATFFVNGVNWSNLEEQPEAGETIKKVYQAGHYIGSHTYYHQDLFEAIDQGKMEVNIDKMTDTIENLIGVKPAFFRPPCGNGAYPDTAENQVKNEKVQKYLGASGYSIIMWGADTRDWEFKANLDAEIAELDKNLKAPGVSPQTHSFIILMHDVHETTGKLVLPKVVEYIQSLGYKFVPLTECIGVQSAYQGVNGAAAANTQSLTGAQSQQGSVAATTTSPATSQLTSAASNVEVKMMYSALAIVLSLFFLF